jgi:hypothetical protein
LVLFAAAVVVVVSQSVGACQTSCNGRINMSKTKSNPIKSGSKDQGFLFEYFESKKWVILPTKNNEDRKDLMKERGWSKRQLATFSGSVPSSF